MLRARSSILLAPLSLCGLLGASVAPDEQADASAAAAFEAQGLQLDLASGTVAVSATVGVKDELLEYLLVAPHGAAHESLFQTEVRPSLVNAALLATGVQPGRNALYVEPADDEGAGGEPTAGHIVPPEGEGFYLYAAWREGDETFLFRVDDLITNLASNRTMRRHRWVFLGSRFVVLRKGEPEAYVADVEGNLINISFFYQGNTLLTAALPECTSQTIWIGNPWLLPERGTPVRLVFSRERLTELPAAMAETLPVVPPPADEEPADGGR